MSDDLQSLPDLLRSFRGHSGYKHVAKKAGVAEDEWRAYEEGSALPSREKFHSIIQKFGDKSQMKTYTQAYAEAERSGQTESSLNPRIGLLRRIARAYNWVNGQDWAAVAERIKTGHGLEVTEDMVTRYFSGGYPPEAKINRKIDQHAFERALLAHYEVSELTEEAAATAEAARETLVKEMGEFALKLRNVVHHIELREAWAKQLGMNPRTIQGFASRNKGSTIGPAKYRQLKTLYDAAIEKNPKLLLENITVIVGQAPPVVAGLDDVAGDAESYQVLHAHIISYLKAVDTLTPDERDALRERFERNPGGSEIFKAVHGLEALLCGDESDWEQYRNPESGSGKDLHD